MVTAKRRRVKSAKTCLACRQCGEPLFVVKTWKRGASKLDRRRRCRACGWTAETVEVFKDVG